MRVSLGPLHGEDGVEQQHPLPAPAVQGSRLRRPDAAAALPIADQAARNNKTTRKRDTRLCKQAEFTTK